MQEIQIFNNPEFGKIRTVIIDKEPWFVGVDVAKALGYKKPTGAVTANVDEGDSLREGISDANGHKQTAIVINESGLYALIFGSKLDSAKKFKKWVTSDVLPSIRKTGGYGAPQTIPEQIQLLAQGNVELNKRVDEVRDKTEKLAERFDKFEKELPLMPNEADLLRETVNKRVMRILGGKESGAYKSRSIVNTIFGDAYRNLKRNFDVRKYNCIKRSQIEVAIRIAEEYVPPVYLAERIERANARQNLNLKGGANNGK